ncbi:uncharacterized protein LOC126878463 isoform X1 [Diabrotica virgifera virgifera]|uniref:Uncharacterized protein n=1 Tax=Diabrotica virgifera virgifera TaxID=50390 RepID=A0ABM5JGU1_DIAVI|nr:uncharacterized protein LOC126878463 isoform X1 [Diabrotica virgifera virgifera]
MANVILPKRRQNNGFSQNQNYSTRSLTRKTTKSTYIAPASATSSSARKLQVQHIYRSSSTSNRLNEPMYQYPVYRKEDHNNIEVVPAIGEVIQDRFQVPPYFPYKTKDSGITYLPPTQAPITAFTSAPVASSVKGLSLPQSFTAPNFDPNSFSSSINQNKAVSSASSTSDFYDSPFNSYNPPPAGNPDDSKNNYAPNLDQPDNTDSDGQNSYTNSPQDDGGPYNFAPTLKQPMAMSNRPGPVKSNSFDDASFLPDTYGSPNYVQTSQENHSVLDDDAERPKHPPRNIDDIYYPPSFPRDQIEENHNNNPNVIGSNPQDHVVPMLNIPPHDLSQPPTDMIPQDQKVSLMNIGPSSSSGLHNDFPKYLYDDHHFDHHIYEEVHHATTPEPEKKRVSTTNYSYYYLGRKLWYIPLYFSIYFMVYVTALIIKSIARRKVTLRNQYITANTRSRRDLTLDHMDALDEVHHNISTAIDKVDKMYSRLSM